MTYQDYAHLLCRTPFHVREHSGERVHRSLYGKVRNCAANAFVTHIQHVATRQHNCGVSPSGENTVHYGMTRPPSPYHWSRAIVLNLIDFHQCKDLVFPFNYTSYQTFQLTLTECPLLPPWVSLATHGQLVLT